MGKLMDFLGKLLDRNGSLVDGDESCDCCDCCSIVPDILYGRICVYTCDCATVIDFTMYEDLTPDFGPREWDAVPSPLFGTCGTTFQLTLNCVVGEPGIAWILSSDQCNGGALAAETQVFPISCYPTEIHFSLDSITMQVCCPGITLNTTVHIFSDVTTRNAYIC